MAKSKFSKAKDRVAGVKSIDEDVRKKNEAAIPEGYESQSSEIVGFWDPEGDGIHGVPMFCRMMDSSIDPTKTSCLVVMSLLRAGLEVLLPGTDGEKVVAEEGQLIGVWAKPGMGGLSHCAGIPTFIYLDGYRDTGKASPMAVFAVLAKTRGTALPIDTDSRAKSRGARDPLGLCPVDASKT